jgi:hypothetical protein
MLLSRAKLAPIRLFFVDGMGIAGFLEQFV